MRQVVVVLHVVHLRVDEDELHLIGTRLEENRRDHPVHADALAGARHAGNEEVGHPREVSNDGIPLHVDAEGDRQERGRPLELLALDHLAERDEVAVPVRHLDADRRPARDPLDADLLRGQREGEVVLEAGHLRDLDARRGLELVGRDDRPWPVAVDDALDPELEALGGDELHRLLELFARLLPVPLYGGAKELLGREDPAVRFLGGGKREDPLRRCLHLLQLCGPRHRDRAHGRRRRHGIRRGGPFGPGGGRRARGPAYGELPRAAPLTDPERREGGNGDDLTARLLFLVLDRRRLARPLEVLLDHRPPRPILLLDLSRLLAVDLPGREARRGAQGRAANRLAERKRCDEEDADEETGREHDDGPGRVEGRDEGPREEVANEAARTQASPEELGAPEAEVEERRRREDHDEEPERLRPPGPDGAGPEPRDTEAEDDERQDERGETEELQRRVGEGGADTPRPVARTGVGVGDGREDRRVARVVGEERCHEEETGRQDEDAEELVAPAMRGLGRPGGFGHRRQRRPARRTAAPRSAV